jgi:isoamylase
VPVRRRGVEGQPDISWFRPDGSEMSDEDWDSGFGKSVAVYLNGLGIPYLDARGQRVTDDSFVLCFNAHHEPIEFTLPPKEFGEAWIPVIYTADTAVGEEAKPVTAGVKVAIDARAVMVLRAAEKSGS